MANTFASGKTQLVEPPYGSYVNEWENPVNSNFGVIDATLSGTTVVDVSTLSPSLPFVTLVFANFDTTQEPWNTPLAGQNLRIRLTGVLPFNIFVLIPANIPGFWIFDNATGGAASITVKTNAAGSTGITIPRGYMSLLYCDGKNVYWADNGNIIANVPQGVAPGIVSTFGGTSVPSGYLACDGATYSTAAYANLFAAIGYTWGGSGTNFNVPNLQGYFIRGAGTSTLDPDSPRRPASTQTETFKSHTHTDTGHLHTYNYPTITTQALGFSGSNYLHPELNATGDTGVGHANITSTGGPETRPTNVAVLYCIKT